MAENSLAKLTKSVKSPKFIPIKVKIGWGMGAIIEIPEGKIEVIIETRAKPRKGGPDERAGFISIDLASETIIPSEFSSGITFIDREPERPTIEGMYRHGLYKQYYMGADVIKTRTGRVIDNHIMHSAIKEKGDSITGDLPKAQEEVASEFLDGIMRIILPRLVVPDTNHDPYIRDHIRELKGRLKRGRVRRWFKRGVLGVRRRRVLKKTREAIPQSAKRMLKKPK